MYDRRVRVITIRTISLLAALSFGLIAFTGVSSAQTAQDPLGAQSATPNVDQGQVEQQSTPGACPSSAAARTAGTDPCDRSTTAPTADTDPGGSEGEGAAALPSTDPVAARSTPATREGASLPFTGFLAIPVLLAGIALLGTGLAVRRRASA